jgi:hypothetical protein
LANHGIGLSCKYLKDTLAGSCQARILKVPARFSCSILPMMGISKTYQDDLQELVLGKYFFGKLEFRASLLKFFIQFKNRFGNREKNKAGLFES